LKVDRRALIPRPETEYMMELVQTALAEPPKRCLDLGTGTGAIALGLAKLFPETFVLAVDRSDEALALAAENAASTGLAARVELRKSSWFSALQGDGPFELIVANPPYLTAQESAEATPEVREFEPSSALVAEDNGVSDLAQIISGAPKHLASGALLALETGIHQHDTLKELCAEAGLVDFVSKQDLTGRDRFVFARKAI
jgi:release factor glutamine methyltransferase